uniref:MD-2-related lipid-recognition domain-containing protein n=1 Tax=Heliothis virescens TaxID=7102 RepID=A0A2A4K8D6_HELVI
MSVIISLYKYVNIIVGFNCEVSVLFKMGLVNIVLLALLFTCGFAKVAVITNCDETNENVCKVNEVRITPCTQTNKCLLRLGSDASISFDFTPNFSTSKLKTLVYWANGAVDLPFFGFGSNDACTYTSCPSQSDQLQTLNYNLHVSKKLPKGTYTLKWKVWDEDNDTSNLCCFKTTIRLA